MSYSPSRRYRRRHYERDPRYDDDDDYYYSEEEVKEKPRSRSREVISRIGSHITGRSRSSRRGTHSADSRDYSSRDYSSRDSSRRDYSRRDHSRRDRRDRDYDNLKRSSTQPSRKLEHAIDAAIEAAAVEAVRVRKQPGKWAGSKGTRVATAAAGAALVDSMLYERTGKHGKLQKTEAIIGGLLANRVFNGGRKELRR